MHLQEIVNVEMRNELLVRAGAAVKLRAARQGTGG